MEWLGDVPSHWKVEKLKNFCEIFASNVDKKNEVGETEVSLCNYVDVYKNDKIDRSIDFMTASATRIEIEKFSLKLNDIILTKDSETPEDIAIPSIVKEVFENFLCGYHLSIVRCQKKIIPDFLIWALRDLYIATQFHREAIGITRFGLASKHFKNGIFAFPEKNEQTSIAAYLDQATANIDSVVATKKSQLEKLEQYKRSKIHECITKGLNPDVKLKPSGIDWIGEVPEGWKTKRIKDVCNLQSGYNITSEQIFPSGEFPVYGGNGLRGYYNQYTHDGFHAIIGRQGALCGNINYTNGKFWASEHAVVVTVFESIDMFWLGEVMREMNLNQYSQGSAQPGLAVENIRKLKIPFPSRNEQREISSYIISLNEKVSSEKNIIEQQIEKLKQYRKSLIHECVTGKRKVIP